EPSFKTIAGGFYDIDFLTSFLLVTSGGAPPRQNIRETLAQLAARGLLNTAAHSALDAAAELLRSVEHVIRLVLGRPRKWLPAAEWRCRRTAPESLTSTKPSSFPRTPSFLTLREMAPVATSGVRHNASSTLPWRRAMAIAVAWCGTRSSPAKKRSVNSRRGCLTIR